MSMAATGAGGERLAAVRAWWAEYEYGILDGAAVVPKARLGELERQLAAAIPALLTALDAARARLAATTEALLEERAARKWETSGTRSPAWGQAAIPEATREVYRRYARAELLTERALLDAAHAPGAGEAN